MKSRRHFIKNSFKGLIVLVTGLVAGCKKQGSTAQDNPYKYDIDIFKKIDEKLLKYKEVQKIKVKARKLFGITINNSDQIFVSGDTKIFQFNTKGKLIRSFLIANNALCLASDKKDEIFVGMRDHVEIYNVLGRKISEWTSLGDKAHITSIAVKKDNVAIADYGNKRVWLYSKKGILKRIIGEKNISKNVEGFIIPSPYFDVAFRSETELWVANTGRTKLEKYSLNGTRKTFWGRPSMDLNGFSGCCNPSHFTLLPNGDFVTAEKGLIRIKIHDQEGKLKCVVAGPKSFKEGTVGLDMAVDSDMRIYVLDPYYKNIRIFVRKEEI